ncbi:MAG: outer membrane protein transport protein [Sutterella sp.]|nr:outer membrane protein transport protein [Sutterella sp.]
MKNASFKIAAAALAVASAFVSQANAAGFMLTEQSAGALGRAYAGVGVDGNDIAGTYYNPATMSLHDGTKIQAGVVQVGMNLDYAGNSGATENGRLKSQTLPHGYITHKINDSMWAGLAMTVPFGMGTEFGENWEGSERGISAEMYTFDFNPNLAWKVTDKFTVGAGVSIQYANAKLKTKMKLKNTELGKQLTPALTGIAGTYLQNGDYASAQTVAATGEQTITSEIKVDSIAWGFNLGLMWAPVENFRVGLSYRSKVSHDADGDLTISGNNNLYAHIASLTALNNQTINAILPGMANVLGTHNGEASLSTPAWAMVNAVWDVNDLLSLYATFRWSDWSSFKQLKITSNGVPQATIDNYWKDTYLGSLGADLRLTDWWTLRGGVAYESSPISNPQNRLGIIPDADRWWFAVGSTFKLMDNLQTDVSFAHLHGVHERSIYKDNGEEWGKFRKLDAYLFGVQLVYAF